MLYLKADTITEVVVGPAVAVGDAFTPVTNLVGASADEFEIIKHGATATTTIAGTLAAITGADGYYALDLSATDTNTEGRLTLLINDDSLILPIRMEFMVVNANVFDSMFAVAGTDKLQVDVVEQVGGTVPTPNTAGIPDVNVREWLDVAVTLSAGNKPEVALLAATQATIDVIDGAAGLVFIKGIVDLIFTSTGTTLDTKVDDIPTVAELNLRTLPTASYFDPAADTVANVTTVGSVTTKTGYALVATGLDLVLIDGKAFPVATQIIAASVIGIISGAGTGTEVFKGLDKTTTRATVTVDASGNRSAIIYV